jgi:hypothetical protein
VQCIEAKSCRRRIIGGGKEQQAIGRVAILYIESRVLTATPPPPPRKGGVSVLSDALSCFHVYWGRGEGERPYFILMLSVRVLGGEGWHLFTSGSLAFPPPFYGASLFYAFAKYCILLFFNNL